MQTKTKLRHVWASFLALTLCVTMLIGSTYAWFTDTVTSTGNIIKSGTLSVGMLWADGDENPVDTTNWINVEDESDPSNQKIFGYELWEPGYVQVRHIKVINKGTLALKYNLTMLAKGDAAAAADLAEVIDVYTKTPAVKVADRGEVATKLNRVGTLREVMNDTTVLAAATQGHLSAGEGTAVITIALKMQETAGNEYQDKQVNAGFDVKLFATQWTEEEDTFDNQYDKMATYDSTNVTYREYNSSTKQFTTKTANVVPITADMTTLDDSGTSNGWYAVTENVTISDRITVSGTVNLILADGAKLDALKGITVGINNTLSIYGQSNGTGTLNATGFEVEDETSDTYTAGIGEYSHDFAGTGFGTVNIHGGKINATGRVYGVGIGGSYSSSVDIGTVNIYGGTIIAQGGSNAAGIGGIKKGCTVNIYEGNVTATGGKYGAGIGGGQYGDGGTVTINGGTVTATGGTNGAGIGGGYWEAGGDVTINGGTVTATGGEDGAGIGGGFYGAGGDVTITGGTVTATSNHGAGIGGGYGGGNGTLTVADGLVVFGGDSANPTAEIESPYSTRPQYMVVKEKEYSYSEYDVSTRTYATKSKKAKEVTEVTSITTTMSDGWYVVTEDVTISDRITVSGTVNLILADGAKLDALKSITVGSNNTLSIYGQSNGTGALNATGFDVINEDKTSYTHTAGIGEYSHDFAGTGFGTVNIHGGNINATGSARSAGIGSSASSSVDIGTVNIYGGTIIAQGGSDAAGIGGGPSGQRCTVNIYEGNVTATGGTNGAGIGGGYWEAGGDVTINGGTVTATGGKYGAGIGGGYQGRGGDVTINGGIVTATGVELGAGIGGGSGGDGGTVTINGGTVTATGGEYTGLSAVICAGIGAGAQAPNHGTLKVASGWTVYGGSSANPTAVIESPYKKRQQYMVVKEKEYSYSEYDVSTRTYATKSKKAKEVTEVTSITTTMSDGWYVVTEDVTISDRITVSGTVNLILADGAKLDALKGITVGSDNTLSIYGQSNGTGALNATGFDVEDETSYTRTAGIGEYKHDSAGTGFGTVNIHGGKINATGSAGSAGSAGIGSAAMNTAEEIGTVNIYGGTIIAQGGSFAAGIGGCPGGQGCTVNIYEGNVTATGKGDGAGIGGGQYGAGGDVTINGGIVTATGGKYGAGIGGGYQGAGGNVTVNGGTVTATGGEYGTGICAGIGAGAEETNHGILTVASDLAVYGDDSIDDPHDDPKTEIDSPYDSRPRYMIVR